MITLGIETSGRAGSVALVIDGLLCAERQLSASGRRHARTLVPEMGSLLEAAQLRPRDVDVVAVSVGPGSFTGLRVGVVCAKTFAFAAGCRIVGVDTFLAVADNHPHADRLWVIEDALRGDVFAGEYQRVDGVWCCVVPSRLIPLAQWRGLLMVQSVVTGPGVDSLAEALSGLTLAASEYRTPHAGQIARIGESSALAGRTDDLWTIEPLYIRRSAAEEKADLRG